MAEIKTGFAIGEVLLRLLLFVLESEEYFGTGALALELAFATDINAHH